MKNSSEDDSTSCNFRTDIEKISSSKEYLKFCKSTNAVLEKIIHAKNNYLVEDRVWEQFCVT